MFISLDGIDGVGKSTQWQLLCDWLRAQGRDVVACRDPGSTPLGEAIRKLLLSRSELKIDRTAEMLLYMAARAQMVDEIIAPALEQGKTVVSDRYLLANVVYQGHAGGLDPEEIWQVGKAATRGISPALTIVLDMPIDASAARIARPLDRMESQGDAYRAALREGFLHEAARRPREILVVDASGSIDAVQAAIRATVQKLVSD